MNPCELVTLISTLSCAIARDKSDEEISLLASIFTQLGDSLATIAATQAFNESNISNNNCD